MVGGMVSLQIYATEQLKKMLVKEFGEGRVSANVERILRAHLSSPENEKKLRLEELNREIRRFNSDFMMGGELVFPEKEEPPKPPEEKEVRA